MQETKRHPGKISKLAWPIAAIVSLTPGLLSTPVLAQGIEEVSGDCSKKRAGTSRCSNYYFGFQCRRSAK